MGYLSAPVDLAFYAARHWLQGLPDGSAPDHALVQFFQTKAEALPDTDVDGRRAFSMLAAAAWLDLRPSSRSSPFGIMMQAGNLRSPSITDFGPEDVDTLANIAGAMPELAVRARLADVAWEAGKQCGHRVWPMAVLAAQSYAHTASAQLLGGDELVGREALERGLELAWQFRKQAPTVLDELWRLVEATARAALDRPVLLIILADHCVERQHALALTLAPLLEEAAQRLLVVAGPALEHAELWGRAAKLWHLAGDEARRSQARLNEAEGFVSHAEAGAANAMFAAHWMKVGLEALRQAGAAKERSEAVHERLLELQQAATGELRQISQEIDVRPLHDRVMAGVSGKSFEEALFGLVRLDDLINVTGTRERVLENARRHPLSGSMSQELMNYDGLTIGRRGSLLDGTDDERELALQHASFHDAARWELHLRGDVIALRAAQTIYNEHHPSESDVASYVVGHPFVPEGIQVSIIRGLTFGFDGDWLAAGTYLIPRMEALVRHWLKLRGVVTSGVDSDGFQAERPLTELFKLPQAREVFGEKLLFELRCHLTEKWGYDLRNTYAHGLSPDGEVASAKTVSLWWLLWRVLLTPLLAQRAQAEAVSAAAQSSEEPGSAPVADDN